MKINTGLNVMNYRMPLATFFATLAVSAFATIASAAGWPSAARPVLTPTVTYEAFDGGEIEHLTLDGDGVLFRTGNDVTLRSADPDSQYSILFQSTRYPGATLGLALFGKSEFVSSIESSAWNAYPATLKARYPFELTIVTDRPPEETAKGVPIMGAPYRELTFSFRMEEEGPVMMRRETFIMMKDRLLVASVEAPENYFEAMAQTMRSFLVGLDRQK
ncbi:MAG: hypothetical protein R3F07_19410 [Opitutaceae bacterium]